MDGVGGNSKYIHTYIHAGCYSEFSCMALMLSHHWFVLRLLSVEVVLQTFLFLHLRVEFLS